VGRVPSLLGVIYSCRFSLQGRVLHHPRRGFVAGRDFQLLLVRKCGAACFLGWAVFLIPGGRVFFLYCVGGKCEVAAGRPPICGCTLHCREVYCCIGGCYLTLNQQQNSHYIIRPFINSWGTVLVISLWLCEL
jgi:hypothetical protein